MRKIDLVCIVDDDPIYLFGIKKMIKVVDFCNDFVVFNNGQEAINGLNTLYADTGKVPDIIFLDLNMPILDGWQFLEEFVGFPLEKKIIIYVVSSSIDQFDIEKALSYSSVKNYIYKPIGKKDFQKILEDYQAN